MKKEVTKLLKRSHHFILSFLYSNWTIQVTSFIYYFWKWSDTNFMNLGHLENHLEVFSHNYEVFSHNSI